MTIKETIEGLRDIQENRLLIESDTQYNKDIAIINKALKVLLKYNSNKKEDEYK